MEESVGQMSEAFARHNAQALQMIERLKGREEELKPPSDIPMLPSCGRARFEREVAFDADQNAKASDLVNLNIGGRSF